MIRALLALTLLLPASTHAETFKALVNNQVVPLVDSMVKLLYGLAFLFFLYGMFRFFFSQDDEERKKGKTFMFWGIIGLVVLFGVWGFVSLLLSALPGSGV